MADFKSLEALVMQLHGSLIQEIQGVSAQISELRTELRNGLEKVEATLKTHRGMMLAGTLAYHTLGEAVSGFEERETKRERRDALLRDEVRQLQERLKKLEEKDAA